MAMIALHSAASALNALSTSLDVTANNLANANTDGFKSSRANFQDLMYLERRQPGLENAAGDQSPTGLYVGLGTKLSGTQANFETGSRIPTERDLDFIIEGNGFFRVKVGDGQTEDGFAYTRAGHFTKNSDGTIVLATDQGRSLDPPIVVPDGASQIDVRGDGKVYATFGGSQTEEEIGDIQLYRFINPAGLKQIGETLFGQSTASGDAEPGQPSFEGFGKVANGALEGSNVNPVRELISLIETQRAFELNSQSIQAADETLRTIGQLRSF